MPKNDFGNIDLYVPSMLPAGAAYIPRTYTLPRTARHRCSCVALPPADRQGRRENRATTGFRFRGGSRTSIAAPAVARARPWGLTCVAQTGFEFKKRRAFPVITGVVVAAENEQALLEVSRAARAARCLPGR